MRLPAELRPEIDGFEIKLGKKRYFFRAYCTPFNDHSSAHIALNKYCTNKLLEKAGIPVPKATIISLEEFKRGKLEQIIQGLTFPLVIKPTIDGAMGRDVICNVKTIHYLKSHLIKAFNLHEFLTLEEYHGNLQSYRVLVFKNQVIGVIKRYPAYVIGDGKHTIKELIEITNTQRARLNDALAPIVIDDECRARLKELGINLKFVPPPSQKIFLGYTSNASRGGFFESITTKICKHNRKLMTRAAANLNLNLAGIDVECEDINKPIGATGGVIIEINHNPSIKIHECPIVGQSNPVTKKILRSLIWRHPLSYLYVLYTTSRSFVFYMRSLFLMVLFSAIYKLL